MPLWPRAGGGALEGFLGSYGLTTTPETQLADHHPRLGRAFQVAVGFQHRCGRITCLECIGQGSALPDLDVRLQDPDPGLSRGQARLGGDLHALGQGSLCPVLVAGRIQHRPEQPVQVSLQPPIGWARGQRAF